MNKKSAFRFNIRDIYQRPGQMRELSENITVTQPWGEGIARIEAGSGVSLRIRLESVHEGILATVAAQARAQAECSRCLERLGKNLEVDFVELFAYNPSDEEEYGVHGDHVDLEPPLRDAVVLALPFNPICRKDCAGLDPVTGERLAAGAVAEALPAVDPRWAALADFSVQEDKSAPAA